MTIGGLFNSAKKAAQKVEDAVEHVQAQASSAANSAAQNAGSAAGAAGNAASAAFAAGDALIDQATAVANQAKKRALSAGDALWDAAGQAGDKFENGIRTIGAARSAGMSNLIGINPTSGRLEFDDPLGGVGISEEAQKGAQFVLDYVVDQVKQALNSMAEGLSPLGRSVLEVGEGITDAGGLVGQGLRDIFIAPIENLFLQGRLYDALAAPVRGVDRILFQAPERLWNGVFDGAQGLVDGYIPAGTFAHDAATRAVDVFRMSGLVTNGLVRDLVRLPADVALSPTRHWEIAVRRAFRGDWGGAAASFGLGFVAPIGRLASGVVDMHLRALAGTTSIVATALWLEPPSRPLTDEEKDMLREAYGDSIDLDSVRVKQGSVNTEWLGMAPHTVGNTIYMPDNAYNADGTMTAEGRDTLIHETAHVWQHQTGGSDYMSVSLTHQAFAAIFTGSRNSAYDYSAAAAAGVPFDELNPEQQAAVMEDVGVVAADDGDDELSESDFTAAGYSEAEAAYLMSAYRQMQEGDGSV